MIDNPTQAERLLTKLQEALPVPARATPELLATVATKDASKISPLCSIAWICYAGDEGGIVCRLDFEGGSEPAVFASLTHLRFDARLPLAREIAAYQKRVKRLQRRPA